MIRKQRPQYLARKLLDRATCSKGIFNDDIDLSVGLIGHHL